MKGKEVMSAMGNRWKEMSDDDKSHYENLAKHDKVRYSDEMKHYNPSDEWIAIEKSCKKNKRKPGPKNVRSSYIFFCIEHRKEVLSANNQLSTTDVMCELGRIWSNMSAKKKIKYQKLYEDDKIRYANDLEGFESSKKESPKKESPKKESPKKESPKKESKKESPKKELPKKELPIKISHEKNGTGILAFTREMLPTIKSEYPDYSDNKIHEIIKKQWKNMDENEKSEYD